MLKRIAEIDWKRVGPSLFLTLTYPDDVAHNDKDRRNKERYLFLRAVEMYLGRRCCGLWRVEYKPRKSGEREGEVLAHMHMMIFGVSFIEEKQLKASWRSALGTAEFPHVWIESSLDGLGATKYIAKYCGKVEDAAIKLAKVTYLNSGRHYGYHRARCIPVHPELEFPLLDPAAIHYIRVQAGHFLRYLDLDFFETFTLLGEFALKCAKVVSKNSFDLQGQLDYIESIKGKQEGQDRGHDAI